MSYPTLRDNYLLSASSDGRVEWIFPEIFKSYCSLNIRYFPFDRSVDINLLAIKPHPLITNHSKISSQTCKLEFQPWSRSKKEVIVQYNKQTLVDNHTIFHTEWEIMDINVTNNEFNDFVWLEYNLLLKRNWAFFGNTIILILIQCLIIDLYYFIFSS